MKKKNKKTPQQKARKEADATFQRVGLELNPLCEVCGKKATVVHHFIAKSLSNALRYDLGNAVSLCFSHHQKIHSVADPEIRDIIEAKRGKGWYNKLKQNRRKEVKTNTELYLKAKIKLEKLKEKQWTKQKQASQMPF